MRASVEAVAFEVIRSGKCAIARETTKDAFGKCRFGFTSVFCHHSVFVMKLLNQDI